MDLLRELAYLPTSPSINSGNILNDYKIAHPPWPFRKGEECQQLDQDEDQVLGPWPMNDENGQSASASASPTSASPKRYTRQLFQVSYDLLWSITPPKSKGTSGTGDSQGNEKGKEGNRDPQTEREKEEENERRQSCEDDMPSPEEISRPIHHVVDMTSPEETPTPGQTTPTSQERSTWVTVIRHTDYLWCMIKHKFRGHARVKRHKFKLEMLDNPALVALVEFKW